MRPPFAVAYALIVVLCFVADWRAGLAILAWLPISYIRWRFFAGFGDGAGDGPC